MPSASPSAHRVSTKLAGTECTFETGRIARQATAAVVARAGDLVILATVVGARHAQPGASFFPLTIEYREKFSATGRIPGSHMRREGRISDHEILRSRLIDRTLRSLFPADYRAEVQIQVTVLSADPAVDPTTLALLAACAAVHISPLPAQGPAAGLRILRNGETFSTFPANEKRAAADLDFVVSIGPDGLVMCEGTAAEVSEADCVDALSQAIEWLEKARDAFAKLADSTGTAKWPFPDAATVTAPSAEAAPELPDGLRDQLAERLRSSTTKESRREATADLLAGHLATVEDDTHHATHTEAFKSLRTQVVRQLILDGHRPDGRGPKDIRAIWSEIGWLPRAHGSAIFTRGETQALVTATLGSPDDAQRLDDLSGYHEERFLLHYNFPPYSVGETRPLRGPGRREIGHGNLARNGLAPLLPGDDSFPYTIRVESEISESNGSSSMATVCGGSLALFHAGVPMTRAAAGIAMGMVQEGDRAAILSDIVGEEDHLGDMDFKVVGTEQGVTALQLDNKIGGLAMEALMEAFEQAAAGRRHILGEMRKTIAEPARDMPPSAPRVTKIDILPESVGALVGPRGATIKEIQKSTGARVSVGDGGAVLIYASEGEASDRATRAVLQRVGVLERNHCYNGVVTTVKDFGAFVKVNEVNEGLVPKTQIAETPVERPGDLLTEGQAVVVKVLGVDDRGRLQLSIRDAIGVDPARIDY